MNERQNNDIENEPHKHIFIAAHNAPQEQKDNADCILSGRDDHIPINQAFGRMPTAREALEIAEQARKASRQEYYSQRVGFWLSEAQCDAIDRDVTNLAAARGVDFDEVLGYVLNFLTVANTARAAQVDMEESIQKGIEALKAYDTEQPPPKQHWSDGLERTIKRNQKHRGRK